MIQYILYRIGMWLVLSVPLKVSYKIATGIAILQYRVCFRDRRAVINNLRVILGTDDKELLRSAARAVFKNFAKYLVDFFRFSVIDERYIKQFVKMEGEEHLKAAFAKGKGVIALTGHVGNWELAGALTAHLGYPVNAVALSHRHRRVNELFVGQRQIKGIKVIPVGNMTVRRCFAALQANELIGLLGDRDFTHSGVMTEFFGKAVNVPKGPAMLSLKTGAVIVPTFAVREPDDSYRLFYEKPVDYTPCGDTDEDLKNLTEKVVSIIEDKIRRYPAQWFMFREFWAPDANRV